MKYNAQQTPDPERWLKLDELERISLVQKYHETHDDHDEPPSMRAHAAFHAVVENQLATDPDGTVAETLERLRKEGLTRHDAIHAIGSVVANYMYDITQGVSDGIVDNESYYQALREFSAQKWLDSVVEEAEEVPPIPQVTLRNPHTNLGRNAPCHCGSGKKYKKCCWHQDQAETTHSG